MVGSQLLPHLYPSSQRPVTCHVTVVRSLLVVRTRRHLYPLPTAFCPHLYVRVPHPTLPQFPFPSSVRIPQLPQFVVGSPVRSLLPFVRLFLMVPPPPLHTFTPGSFPLPTLPTLFRLLVLIWFSSFVIWFRLVPVFIPHAVFKFCRVRSMVSSLVLPLIVHGSLVIVGSDSSSSV